MSDLKLIKGKDAKRGADAQRNQTQASPDKVRNDGAVVNALEAVIEAEEKYDEAWVEFKEAARDLEAAESTLDQGNPQSVLKLDVAKQNFEAKKSALINRGEGLDDAVKALKSARSAARLKFGY